MPVDPFGQSISAGYEERDVNTRRLVYFLAVVGLVLILSAVGLRFVFEHFVKSARANSAVAQPFDNDRPLPPEPRLQNVPEDDHASYLASQQNTLNTYGVVDRGKGVVRIPIERAMQLVLQHGLPTRPSENKTERSTAGATDIPLSRQSATKGSSR